MLACWSNKLLFILMLAGILWTPSTTISTSELTLISICFEQKEDAMAELPRHIDLLRWVPKASLLSFLRDPGAYWDGAKPSQTHAHEGYEHSALGAIGFLK